MLYYYKFSPASIPSTLAFLSLLVLSSKIPTQPSALPIFASELLNIAEKIDIWYDQSTFKFMAINVKKKY